MLFPLTNITNYLRHMNHSIDLINMNYAELSIKDYYKFVEKTDYAKKMCAGEFRIGTLSQYRKIENKQQGDQDEAIHEYNSGKFNGKANDKSAQIILDRLGIKIDGGGNVFLDNNKRIDKIQDAFVFCLTETYAPKTFAEDFGGHCVSINHLDLLFYKLTEGLRMHYKINSAKAGRIIYAERKYEGLDQDPGELGFVKPAERFGGQSEIRFLWAVEGPHELSPLDLKIPEIRNLIKQIL